MSSVVTHSLSPREVVDRQLCAYNARDIDAYCGLFAADAVLSNLNTGAEFVCGVGALRAFYIARFSNARLHCRIRSRIELGNFVVDWEEVDGIKEGLVEVIAIYEIRDSLIRTVRFIWP